jgi:hypothetical protein
MTNHDLPEAIAKPQSDHDRVELLRAAIHRVAMVAEWCKTANLLNVGADMRRARDEIASVIYSFKTNESEE